MKVSTLTDELVIATQGIAEVYSIAPTREMAVLAAGHASKGAFWLNDETGKWSGSTYYGTCLLYTSRDVNASSAATGFEINDFAIRF